ncbi:MAG: ABC transporter permease [Planctomyces sp.]|nr:ABC transporter permease [Planctomyces sp.]
MSWRESSPLWQLVMSRIRLFLREPSAVFWVYGFPLLMLVALGTAFRDDPQERIMVDVVGSGNRETVLERLRRESRFQIATPADDGWRKRLQYGKTDLVVEADAATPVGYRLWEEPRRAESRLARYAVEAALNGPATSTPGPASGPEVRRLEGAGSRYIDFLLPGMIGMGLMGGGVWGVGFVLADMRVRKLLKLFIATPMRRGDFLASILISRVTFTVLDVVFLIAVGAWVFDVRCQGSYLELGLASLMGAACFAGIGLLIASRAQTIETVSGLMNLVLLPMWVFSGVFFSSERFPAAIQPVVNLLPLTALNQLLRGIMLEGASMFAFWPQLLLLAGYGVGTFFVALKIFRWR